MSDLKQAVKNKLCIDGHFNLALDSIMRSDNPDGKFCIIGNLARNAVDMSFDAVADRIAQLERENAALQADLESYMQASHAEARLVSELQAENEALREVMRTVVDANPRKWEELSEPMGEFERWAKSRLNHALSLAPDAKVASDIASMPQLS